MHLSFRLFLFLMASAALLTLPLLSACDSPPGSSPYPTANNAFHSISLDPDNVVFDPDEGVVNQTLNINISVDVRSDAELSNPRFNVYRSSDRAVFRDGSLTTVSEGELAGEFSFSVSSTSFETYKVYVFDEGAGGSVSNTLEHKLVLTGIPTDPPVVLSLDHPPVVQIPDEGETAIRFETEVEHPQGLEQISAVYLELFDSNGNQIGGDRFEMFDDGDEESSGDLVAGDGIYTRTFAINPNNQPDTYDVFTYAVDRAGLTSDTLSSQLIIE